jgi:dTDP-4-dehydrorhamnose reductase
MLGRAFAEEAAAFPQFDVRALGRSELDVRDAAAFAPHLDWLRGGWIFHCAATVDVEGCARDPESARVTIVEGTRNVAAAAKAASARVLYPQSFLTYDGLPDPIPEAETPRPLSLYGAYKYAAEQLLIEMTDDPLVIAMAGFFGGDAADKNFVGRIIPAMHRAMLAGETVFKVGDRVWQPTWTKDLAFNALYLAAVGATGRYQMACHGHATFHEIAHEIVQALGWADRFRIEPVAAGAVATSETGATRRPDRAVLSCERLRAEHRDLQRDWRSTLHAYLTSPFFDQYR